MLDVHTSKWVVEKCLSGNLLRGRTVILVTHNLSATARLAKRVVSVSAQGVVTAKQSTEEAILQHWSIARDYSEDGKQKPMDQIDEFAPIKTTRPSLSEKLITDEEVALGHVSFSAGAVLVPF